MDKADILEKKLLGEGGVNYYKGEAEEGILGDHESRLKRHDKIVDFVFSLKGFFMIVSILVLNILSIWIIIKQAMAK